MSTMSLLGLDHTDRLAKRFASLATQYLDTPNDAQTDAAKIPLENLFRLLQMYRYDAFSDEPRSGVLELRPLLDASDVFGREDNWHKQIGTALDVALNDVFKGAPREEAVSQVQSALCWLVTNANEPPQEVRERAKAFFARFATSLA
jgi:hypothetical protein